MNEWQNYTRRELMRIIDKYCEADVMTHDKLASAVDKKGHARDYGMEIGAAERAEFDRAMELRGTRGAWMRFASEPSPENMHGLMPEQRAIAELILGMPQGNREKRRKIADLAELALYSVENFLNYYGPMRRKRGKRKMPQFERTEEGKARHDVRLDISPAVYEAFKGVMGMTGSKAVIELIEMVGGFDSDTWARIRDIAEDCNVPLSALLRNCAIAWLVRMDERIALLKTPDFLDSLALATSEGKPIDFEATYRTACREELERDLCEDIKRKDQHGIPLQVWERMLLIKHKEGDAYHGSADGRIPPYIERGRAKQEETKVAEDLKLAKARGEVSDTETESTEQP